MLDLPPLVNPGQGRQGTWLKYLWSPEYVVIPSLRHSWKAHFVSALHVRSVGLEDV